MHYMIGGYSTSLSLDEKAWNAFSRASSNRLSSAKVSPLNKCFGRLLSVSWYMLTVPDLTATAKVVGVMLSVVHDALRGDAPMYMPVHGGITSTMTALFGKFSIVILRASCGRSVVTINHWIVFANHKRGADDIS